MNEPIMQFYGRPPPARLAVAIVYDSFRETPPSLWLMIFSSLAPAAGGCSGGMTNVLAGRWPGPVTSDLSSPHSQRAPCPRGSWKCLI